MALATGTAWVITGVTATSRLDQIPPAMDLSFHAAPQRWTVSQFLGGFGATVDWWLQQTWQPARSGAGAGDEGAVSPPECRTDREHARQPRTALHAAERAIATARLQPPGGTLAGLQLAHTRADMARAILEGCAFEVRWALDQLCGSGLPTTELWIAGGASASPVWPQILADVTGVPIVLADYANWAALGGAALAGWGAGAFPTLEEAVTRLQPPVRRLRRM